jgi:hypothetical protein
MKCVRCYEHHGQSRAKTTQDSKSEYRRHFETPRLRVTEIGCEGEVESRYGDQEQAIYSGLESPWYKPVGEIHRAHRRQGADAHIQAHDDRERHQFTPAPRRETDAISAAQRPESRRQAVTCLLGQGPPFHISNREFYKSDWNVWEVISQSRRIFAMSPGPVVSPAWTGTTVLRPSLCCRK